MKTSSRRRRLPAGPILLSFSSAEVKTFATAVLDLADLVGQLQAKVDTLRDQMLELGNQLQRMEESLGIERWTTADTD